MPTLRGTCVDMRGICVELRRGGGGLRRIRTGLDDVPGGCVSDSSGSAAGWMTREGDVCRAQAGRQRVQWDPRRAG